MAVTAKEILIIFIGIVGFPFLVLLAKVMDFQSLNFFGGILIAILVVTFLILLMYKRLNEINDDLEKQNQKYLELDKRLKMYEKLTNLEARIIALENKNG